MVITKVNRRTVGAVLWVLNAQYFVMQFIVASAWSDANAYSWANNTISDLGNTFCGSYGVRYVCSPLNVAMNVSFVVLGATIIGGAVLLQQRLAHNFVTRLGFSCMVFAGIGAILVGFFPENTVSSLHVAGAALSFLLGNLGMILLAINLKWLPKVLRFYTLQSGVVGLIALLFFMKNAYLGLGIGGIERIVAYPQTIWMIVFGAWLLLSHTYNKAQ